MKRFVAIGCLFTLLFLSACGVNSQGKNPTTVPPQPVETPNVVEPSAASDRESETDLGETVSDDSTPSLSNQEQQSASGSFTGVMGTEFVVPDGFIQLYESPNIGYQYTFWHPDYEIRIVVYEIAPGYIPEGAYETDYNIAKKNPDVTYFTNGDNWFVQSEYNNNGEEIFYSKESSTDNGLKTFWISYPTAKREFGDRISAEFEKNFLF